MLTFAPSTGLPVVSTTCPLTIPVDCPAAGIVTASANRAAHATSHWCRPLNPRTMEILLKDGDGTRLQGLVYSTRNEGLAPGRGARLSSPGTRRTPGRSVRTPRTPAPVNRR